MRIYFAHATCDFNSEWEVECYRKIRSMFDVDGVICDIVNPKDILMNDEDRTKLKGNWHLYIDMMEKYYFSEIDKCDILIAFRAGAEKCKKWKGKLGNGVVLEVKHAIKKGKKVLIFLGGVGDVYMMDLMNVVDDCSFLDRLLDMAEENLVCCPLIIECCKKKIEVCEGNSNLGCVMEFDKEREYIVRISQINFKERSFTDEIIMKKIEGDLYMEIYSEE